MAHDDAAQFLAWVVPWPLAGVEPPEFFVNIHAPTRFHDRPKPLWGGRACTTLREALSYIGFVQRKRAEQGPDDARSFTGDLYVCMSAQRRANGKVAKNGRPYYTAVRGDLNALWHKSFFVDVDEKEQYHGTETRSRFAQFIHSTGLPFPTFIVASGSPGSFHAHWVIDERITTERWLLISQWLVSAMRSHGFKVDYACTTDTVRVLRIPDTFNYKTDPPNPVLLKHAAESMLSLAAIERMLEPYRAVTPPPAQRGLPRASFAFPAGFGSISAHAGPLSELAPNQQEGLPSLADARRCCPLVDHAVSTHGADFPEPLWFETVKLAYYLKEGEAAAHEMSCGYDGYTVEETHSKFAIEHSKRWPTDNWGWPTCQQIKNAGSEQCNACPWMISGEATTRRPLNFIGRDWHIPEETPPVVAQVNGYHNPNMTAEEFGPLPEGYELKRNIIHKIIPPDEDGVVVDPVPVWPYVVKQFYLAGRNLMFDTQDLLASSGWRQSLIPYAAINEMSSMRRVLGDSGFVVGDDNEKLVKRMHKSFVELLQQHKDRQLNTMPQGWQVTDGEPYGFAYGGVSYTPDGERPCHVGDAMLQQLYRAVGRPEPWRDAVKIIFEQDRVVLEVLLLTAFAAPLMEWTGQHGVLLNFRSSASGFGKSATIKAAAAACGLPTITVGKMVGTRQGDTHNSLDNKLGLLPNFPHFVDELHTPEHMRLLIEMLFSLAQGRGRSKLTRNSLQMATGIWSTLLVTASNDSVVAAATDYANRRNEASVYRFLEFEVEQRHTPDSANYHKIFKEIEFNYGHAYEIFAKHLGPNCKAVKARMEELLPAIRDYLGADDAERMWVAAIAALVLAADIAAKLDLVPCNRNRILSYLTTEFRKNKESIAKAPIGMDKIVNKVNFLSSFLVDPRTKLIGTDRLGPSGPGKHGQVVKLTSEQLDLRLVRSVQAQHGASDCVLRVSKKALLEFAKQQGYSPAILKELKELGFKESRKTLGANSPLAKHLTLVQESVLDFDLTRPELQDLIK